MAGLATHPSWALQTLMDTTCWSHVLSPGVLLRSARFRSLPVCGALFLLLVLKHFPSSRFVSYPLLPCFMPFSSGCENWEGGLDPIIL